MCSQEWDCLLQNMTNMYGGESFKPPIPHSCRLYGYGSVGLKTYLLDNN